METRAAYSSNEIAQQAKHQSTNIGSSLADLEDALERLAKELESHEMRLSGVLIPVPPSAMPNQPRAIDPVMSPAGEKICGMVRRVRAMVDQLNSLTARVDA